MRTVDNQRYLLNIGQLYSSDVIHVLMHDKVLDKQDISECIDIVMDNNFEAYTKLDTLVRDHLMDALADTFNFMDYEELMELSTIVLQYQQTLSKINELTPHNNLDKELKQLQKINSKLCKFAININPNGG